MRPDMSDLKFEAGCNLQRGKNGKKKRHGKEEKKIVQDEREQKG